MILTHFVNFFNAILGITGIFKTYKLEKKKNNNTKGGTHHKSNLQAKHETSI